MIAKFIPVVLSFIRDKGGEGLAGIVAMVLQDGRLQYLHSDVALGHRLSFWCNLARLLSLFRVPGYLPWKLPYCV